MSVKFFSNLHEYFSSKSPGVPFFNGRPNPVKSASADLSAAGPSDSASMAEAAPSESPTAEISKCPNGGSLGPVEAATEMRENTEAVGTNDLLVVREEKKSKKSVKFPDDHGHLVTHYFPPAQPFVVSVRTDLDNIQRIVELQDAYMRACRENRVEPLTKVVQQVGTWDLTANERQENLSLKGEKLTEAQLESLEEIFRRVQFVSLDFEYTFLDDETASIVADMVEYYDSAFKLNLSFNQHIGVRGWQSLLRMIRKSPCLDHLNLRYTSITDRAIPVFSRILRTESSLVTLHLENCSLNAKAMVLLVAALKVNTTVRDLYLAENDIGPKDAVHFYSLILHNTSIQLLDVRNNNLQDAGLSMICDALRNPMCNSHGNLHTLVLWNVKLTHQGMTHLARALLENKTLETLNLGCNNIGSQGIETLKDSITRNRTLTRLGLQGTKLHCPGAIAVAECLADNPVLVRVDLRDNPDIKLAGLLALHLTLKLNTSMTTLNLDKSCVQGPHAKVRDYAEQFQRLYDEIEEFCQRNRKLYVDAVRKKHPSLSNVSSHSDIGGGDGLQHPSAAQVVEPEELMEQKDPTVLAAPDSPASVSPSCVDDTESIINPIEDYEDTPTPDADEPTVATGLTASRFPRDLSFTCVETVDQIGERFAAMPCIKDETEFEVDFTALDEGLDSVGAEVPPSEVSVDTLAESMAKTLTSTGIEEFAAAQLKKATPMSNAQDSTLVANQSSVHSVASPKAMPSAVDSIGESKNSAVQPIPSFNPHSQRPAATKAPSTSPRVTIKQVVSPMRRKFVVSKVPPSEETAVDCQFRRRAVSESATEVVVTTPVASESPPVAEAFCVEELNNNNSPKENASVDCTVAVADTRSVEETILAPVCDEDIKQLVKDMVTFCVYECGETNALDKGKVMPHEGDMKKSTATESPVDAVVKSTVRDLVNYVCFEEEHEEMLSGRCTSGRLTLPRSYVRHNQRFAPSRCNNTTASGSATVEQSSPAKPSSSRSTKYAERRRSMDGTTNALLALRLKALQSGVTNNGGCQPVAEMFKEIPGGAVSFAPPM